jgi:uncharacterized membrane protein
MVGLGFLAGETTSQAFAASANGAVIAGQSGARAARWVQGGGWEDLSGALPPHTSSFARGSSADGTVVVGGYDTLPVDGGGFLWRQGSGVTLLLPFVIPTVSGITGVSGDGTVMSAYTGIVDDPVPLRLTETGSSVLPELPNPGFQIGSLAWAISSDAGTIVGESHFQAFRWTQSAGTSGLGFLATPEVTSQAQSVALAVSADAGVVVGWSVDANADARAVLWAEGRGPLSLAPVLERLGLGAAIAGWTLDVATGVAADGTVVVGTGTNPSGHTEAWRAVIPALPPPGGPVPAVSSAPTLAAALLLVGVGLGALLRTSRRRAGPRLGAARGARFATRPRATRPAPPR